MSNFFALFALLVTATVGEDVTEKEKERVFITGASGYLGQFMMEEFSKVDKFELAGGFGSRPDSCMPENKRAQCFYMDFLKPETIANAFKEFVPDVVVNLAAISSIYKCEEDPEMAHKINAPEPLLSLLKGVNPNAIFIQLSTDQVYGGQQYPYGEMRTELSQEVDPLNAYGVSKYNFEKMLMSSWPASFILRASSIFGPKSPRPAAKQSIVQFLDEKICADDKPLELFEDEVRCPVHVLDVVGAVQGVISKFGKLGDHKHLPVERLPLPERLYNAGGMHCFSRAEMGQMVATRKANCDPNKAVKGTTREAVEGGKVKSPKRIVMRSFGAFRHLHRPLKDFEPSLRELLGQVQKSEL